MCAFISNVFPTYKRYMFVSFMLFMFSGSAAYCVKLHLAITSYD